IRDAPAVDRAVDGAAGAFADLIGSMNAVGRVS
ncbi:MAG: hypothetical protein QOD98_1719, partial [Nocardioidaceae bacterium]|nr:hypothetical protein [Nocardioidaceae bacterium]